jgi:hypothetical protein
MNKINIFMAEAGKKFWNGNENGKSSEMGAEMENEGEENRLIWWKVGQDGEKTDK